MTIWAFISDVHGNLPALEKAVATCSTLGIERIVSLGDTLGRGDPDGCVRLVRESAAAAVVGNRDLDWADRVSAESRRYVLGLARVAEASDFIAVHGDCRLTRDLGSDDLRRGFERAYECLRKRDKRLLFFGHTHHARVWRKRRPGAQIELLPAPVKLPAQATAVYIVNVGSVGLPFPGKGPPSFTIYDDQARWIEHVLLVR